MQSSSPRQIIIQARWVTFIVKKRLKVEHQESQIWLEWVKRNARVDTRWNQPDTVPLPGRRTRNLTQSSSWTPLPGTWLSRRLAHLLTCLIRVLGCCWVPWCRCTWMSLRGRTCHSFLEHCRNGKFEPCLFNQIQTVSVDSNCIQFSICCCSALETFTQLYVLTSELMPKLGVMFLRMESHTLSILYMNRFRYTSIEWNHELMRFETECRGEGFVGTMRWPNIDRTRRGIYRSMGKRQNRNCRHVIS